MKRTRKYISLLTLRNYFDYSLKKTATMLNISIFTLRRICKKYGIKRWPNRKINALKRELNNEISCTNKALIYAKLVELYNHPQETIITNFNEYAIELQKRFYEYMQNKEIFEISNMLEIIMNTD
jgi:AraC-like DNA-binding protein